ncbi:MAG: SWIM zinc finger family protein [Persicimonas sp.]
MQRLEEMTEDDIAALFGSRNAQRGERYQREGRVIQPRQTDGEIAALCEGSRADPYRVRIELSGGAIASVSCSCPVVGKCKHGAALLYAWVRNEGAFSEKSTIRKRLESYSKETLLELIDRMVRRQPDLAEDIDVWTSGPSFEDADDQDGVDRAEFVKRTTSRLRRHTEGGWEYGATSAAASEVGEVVSVGRQYLNAGRPVDAAAVFGGVLEALFNHRNYFDDSSGAYGALINETVGCLVDAYDALTERSERNAVLPDLWQAWRHDNEFGGTGVMGTVEMVILDDDLDVDRDYLLDQLEAYVESFDSDDSWSRRWSRNRATDFICALNREVWSDEEYLERLREDDYIERLVPALLDRGLVEEARDRASGASGSDTLEFADRFVEHGLDDAAEQLVLGALDRIEDHWEFRLRDWLIAFYRERGRAEEALPFARANFEARPSSESFLSMREVAQEASRWEELETKAVELLREHSAAELLEVYLEDGAHQEAIELWGEFTHSRNITGRSAQRLAEAVRKTRPDVSIEIWAEVADGFIERRGRSNYQEACDYFAKIRQAYEDTERLHEWRDLAIWLFDEYNRLPAFKDEMRKAGLAPDEES